MIHTNSHETPSCTSIPTGHLRDHSKKPFPNPHNNWRQQNPETPWFGRWVKNLLTAVNLRFHNWSTVSLPFNGRQLFKAKIKGLARRFKPVLSPPPLHPLSPYLCLWVRSVETTACHSLLSLSQTWLLRSAGLQLTSGQTDESTAWQHPGTKRTHRE